MNFYLLFLSLYSFFIFPLRLRIDFRLGTGFSYHLRIRLAGVKPLKRLNQQAAESTKGETGDMENSPGSPLTQMNPALIRCLFSRNLWSSFWRSTQCHRLLIRIRVAFEDAAATALCYGMATVLMHTIQHLCPKDFPLQFGAEAGFSAKGGEIALEGIFSVRLGSLALMASQFFAGYQKARSKAEASRPTALEEEEYGAPSH